MRAAVCVYVCGCVCVCIYVCVYVCVVGNIIKTKLMLSNIEKMVSSRVAKLGEKTPRKRFFGEYIVLYKNVATQTLQPQYKSSDKNK